MKKLPKSFFEKNRPIIIVDDALKTIDKVDWYLKNEQKTAIKSYKKHTKIGSK